MSILGLDFFRDFIKWNYTNFWSVYPTSLDVYKTKHWVIKFKSDRYFGFSL